MTDSSATTWTLRVLSAALVAIAVLLGIAIAGQGPTTSGTQLTLDDLGRLAAAHQIANATFLDVDNRVVLSALPAAGPLAGKHWVAYSAGGAPASALEATVVDSGAKVTVDQQASKRTWSLLAEFVFPLLLLADLFGIFILLARGGAGQVKDLFAFSRIAARRTANQATPARFEDVAALEEAVVELAEIGDYLTNPRRFAQMGALPPKGVLLFGPPGCGKTLLAKALAGQVGVPFFSISGSEFVESLVGVGAARVRDLFAQAKASAPAIIFVDELDAAGRKRGAGIGGGPDEREQTLNEMLVQMDGFAPSLGVVVIGATNRPDILDPALLRPGRFDRHVMVDLPDLAGRREILNLHAKSRPLDRGVDPDAIARATPGFTGADLANVVNEAALLAVRRRGASIIQEDLDEAIERVLAGPRRKGRILTPDELGRLAYHEAGHAVMARASSFPAELRRVSIVARGRNAAHSELARSDRTILTKSELQDQLAVVMAGMAAEELVASEPSTAAESDLERATEIARDIVGRFGMSDRVGRMRILGSSAEVFLGRDYLAAQQHSTETLTQMDGAVSELIAQAEARAIAVLNERRAQLDALARTLLKQETVGEAELDALIGPIRVSQAGRTGRSRRSGLAVDRGSVSNRRS
jgi:cell division protease FtsH